jgi:HlyD family secretion protein
MRRWLALLVVVAVGFAVWKWYTNEDTGSIQFTTVAVGHGPITQTVTATGTLNPVINVTVGSQISGNIQKIFVDFNSPVTANQVVAQLDASTYQAVVHQNEGEVALAESSLELARITAKRKEDLVSQKAAPQADLDSALATLRQAEATLKVKQANLEKAKVDFERCTIRSPVDGTVISRSVDVGQTVAATMNAPVLFTIANDLTKMQIDTNVAEADVGTVEENQNVDFSVDAFPYRVFHGKVSQVRNAATTVQNVVTYDVVVAVDNAELKLKPGMTANVSIVVAKRDDVTKLPNAALRFRMPEGAEGTPGTSPAPGSSPTPTAGAPPAGGPPGGGPPGGMRRPGGRPGGARAERKVYLLATGAAKPEQVDVKLGISDGVMTEVLDGLKPGDLVVTGMILPKATSTPTNPFGGGRRF